MTGFFAAKILARFSNLKEEEVEAFRRAHTNFAPNDIWERRAFGRTSFDGMLAWQELRDILRQGWNKGQVLLEESVTLITLVAYHSQLEREWEEAPDYIKQIPEKYPPEGAENVTKEDLLGLSAYPIEQPKLERISKVWPFQRGIIFLTANPQRARICERYECRARFVAPPNKNNTKYCSRSCFEISHRDQNRKWWKQNRAKTTQTRASSQRDGRS
jgi:hypothetical protein